MRWRGSGATAARPFNLWGLFSVTVFFTQAMGWGGGGVGEMAPAFVGEH